MKADALLGGGIWKFMDRTMAHIRICLVNVMEAYVKQ